MSTSLVLNGLRTKRSQSGISLILFVFLLGLALTGLGIKYLSAGSLQIQRSIDSTQALAEAKAAVIGNVVSSGTNAGQFPCSENTSSIGTSAEGQAQGSCSNTLTSIGRFAWRTLGTGDLRDGNNDKLWYALSGGFQAEPVNSDTVGELAIDGVQNQAIAILFSPGVALSGQSRPTPTAPIAPVVTDYLETENSDGDKDFITGTSSTTFNDKLVSIKPDDIFPVLEKRVLGEIKNYLVAYKAIWHAYPFPAPFSDPSTASYVGNTSTASTGGLLPIADAGLTWASGNGTSVRSSDGNSIPAFCVVSGGGTVLTCTITNQNYSGARALTINANLNKVGLGFYQQMDVNSTSDFQITPAAVKTTSTLSYTLDGAGGGTITLTATPTTSRSTYSIIFKQLPQLDDWNTTAAIPNYIYKNNWQQLIYYKVAQPYLPAGASTCGALCLTVNKIDVTPNTTQTGIHALLISAGRKLDATNVRPSPTYGTSNPAQARPGSSLADYFDSANNIAGVLVFDSTNRPLTTFNDQIQIVE